MGFYIWDEQAGTIKDELMHRYHSSVSMVDEGNA